MFRPFEKFNIINVIIMFSQSVNILIYNFFLVFMDCYIKKLFCQLKGQPLWPGSSDFDQLYLICNTLGELPPRQLSYFQQNEFMKGLRIPDVTSLDTIETKVPVENLTTTGMDFLKVFGFSQENCFC